MSELEDMTPSTDLEDFSVPDEGDSEAIHVRGIDFSSNSLVTNKGRVKDENIRDFLSNDRDRIHKCKTNRLPVIKKSSLMDRLIKWRSATNWDPLKKNLLNVNLIRNYGFEALIEDFEPDSATEKIAEEKRTTSTNNLSRSVPIRTERLREFSFMNCSINFEVTECCN